MRKSVGVVAGVDRTITDKSMSTVGICWLKDPLSRRKTSVVAYTLVPDFIQNSTKCGCPPLNQTMMVSHQPSGRVMFLYK